MPALIIPGAEVRPYAPGDGTTQIPCPACSHCIPAVAQDALTIGEQHPKATFIRCACPEGQGTNITGRRVTCPCHAVFRLHPQGMQRYVVAEGWQEEYPVGWWPRGEPHYECPVHHVPIRFFAYKGSNISLAACPQCPGQTTYDGPDWGQEAEWMVAHKAEAFQRAAKQWHGMQEAPQTDEESLLALRDAEGYAPLPSPPVAPVKRRRRK